ncbi:hypothetical protein I3760_03G252000 [Carya illinoinensis]|nr:hypothetical protein I3760_03G252000 [Carya illinoinensis]
MLKVGVVATMLLLMLTIMHAYRDYLFAPENQGFLIPPTSRTSHSAAVFDHNMAPPRRSLKRAPVPPSKPNPGTLLPGNRRRHLLKDAPALIPGTQIRGHSRPWLDKSPVPHTPGETDIDVNSIGETAET